MKELDIVLERYAAAVLPQANAGERRLFAQLLEHPDPELAGYFLGGAVPAEPAMAALVTRITECAYRAPLRNALANPNAPGTPLGNPPESVHDRNT